MGRRLSNSIQFGPVLIEMMSLGGEPDGNQSVRISIAIGVWQSTSVPTVARSMRPEGVDFPVPLLFFGIEYADVTTKRAGILS